MRHIEQGHLSMSAFQNINRRAVTYRFQIVGIRTGHKKKGGSRLHHQRQCTIHYPANDFAFRQPPFSNATTRKCGLSHLKRTVLTPFLRFVWGRRQNPCRRNFKGKGNWDSMWRTGECLSASLSCFCTFSFIYSNTHNGRKVFNMGAGVTTECILQLNTFLLLKWNFVMK